MSAAIPVLEVRPITGCGNLRAFAKVKVGCFVIHGVRVLQQPGQRAWCALPQTPARKKADGSGAGWFSVIEISNRDVLDQLRAAVLDAWQQKQAEPPARQAERGRQTAEAIDERAAAWSQSQRDQHTEELARRFGERGPDSVDDP
jgi:DNA-binding cell septation regulator SpoVG